MREVPIESWHRNVGAYERCIEQGVKQVQGRALSGDVIDSVNRPAVIWAPVNASDVTLSANDNCWPRDKCLVVPADDST